MENKDDSAAAYERNASAFLANRDRSNIGYKVVRDWAAALAPASDILELGCGGGYPVTAELERAGLTLWAIDGSPSLMSVFRERFPGAKARCERVQESNFFGRKFDAVIAIGLIFLLPRQDQETLIGRVAGLLPSGGRFLFTAPVETGTWRDMNTGLVCDSPGLDAYTASLRGQGFHTITRRVDKGGNNHYDAMRI